MQALQKEESLVVKKLSLDDDLELKSKIIEFNSKSNIVTNGHSVRIIAETISIKNYSADHVQIVSFQEAEKPTGMAGRDAHDIYIFSKNIIGGNLLISNKGENGFQGLQGEKGSPGIDGKNADGGRWKDLRGCVRKKSTKGGRGQKGKMGGVGGNGGSGGDVIFKIENGTSKLEILSTNGGLGGKPGLGGPGGDGGRGGDGSRGRNGCSGESSSEDGPRGPSGDIGLSGVKGKDGKIVDLNNI